MSEMSDSELFSAYLDGELTVDEQVRAERMLAVSPEARQLLEELRAVSSTLQSLPQMKLGEDLSAGVLKIAERRMLAPEEGVDKPTAGRAAAAMTPAGDDLPASEGFPWRELSWRGMFNRRALIWSAIIVVVAIIIHYQSAPGPKGEVAKADSSRKPAATTPASVDAKKEPRPARETAWEADAKKKPDAEGLAMKDEIRLPADQAKRGLDAETIVDGVERERSGLHDEKQTEKALLGVSASAALAKEAASPDVSMKPDAVMKGVANERFKAVPAPPQDSLAMKLAAGPALTVAAPADADKAGSGELEANKTFRQSGQREVLSDGRSAEQSVTMVHLNISATAAANRVFDTLLQRNGLAASAVFDNRAQGKADFTNVKANSGSPNFADTDMPFANTLTVGSAGRQPQSVAQPAPVTNQGQQLLVQNGAAPAAPQAPNSQPSPAVAPPRAATLAGGNSYSLGATVTLANKGGAPATPVDSGLHSQGAMEAGIVQKNVKSHQQELPQMTMSSNVASRNGDGPSPSISYEVDASPAQLSSLLAQLGEQRDAFSPPEVTPPLSTERKLGEEVAGGGTINGFGAGDGGSAGGGGFGGGGGRAGGRGGRRGGAAARREGGAMGGGSGGPGGGANGAGGKGFQYSAKATGGSAADSASAVSSGAGQLQLSESRRAPDKFRDESTSLQTRGTASPPAASQHVVSDRSNFAPAKTRVVFVLNVVDRIAPQPASRPPAEISPAAPANR